MVAAMELFEKMIEQKGLCSEATYGTIINGICKAGETQMAMGLLKRIVNFEGIKLDLYSFNAVIDGRFYPEPWKRTWLRCECAQQSLSWNDDARGVGPLSGNEPHLSCGAGSGAGSQPGRGDGPQ